MKKIPDGFMINKFVNQSTKLNQQQSLSTKNNSQNLTIDDQNMIKFLVKKVIRQKSLQIQKQKKRLNDILSKKSISVHKKSLNKNQDSILQKINEIKQSKNCLKNQQYSNDICDYKGHCQNCSDCNCRKHFCKINYSQKDPSSKFMSIYKRNSQQVKMNYKQQKPELMASYLSEKISKVPTYHPKFDSLYFQSQYTKDYNQNKNRCQQNTPNFNYLKQSNVKIGTKNLQLPSHFQSAYNSEYKQIDTSRNKKNDPFIVNNPENLNAFGLKYHSPQSNYGSAFKNQNNLIVKRDSLKPIDTFKQLDLYLIKQTGYQLNYSPKAQKKSSKKLQPSISNGRHHLSSSLSKLQPTTFKQPFQSSYKNEFQLKQIKSYACPCSNFG